MAIASAAHRTTIDNQPPSDAAIHAQLARILASKHFDATPRNRRFLQYIVRECLEGRSHLIKGYSIGIEVFGRTASFDAQSDPVVRIEASRLRRDLERYYLLSGQKDLVLITIPKGGYVPIFTSSSRGDGGADPKPVVDQPDVRPWSRKHMAIALGLLALVSGSGLFVHDVYGSLQVRRSPEPVRETVVVVVPFEDITQSQRGTALAGGVTDEIIGLLAKLPNITTVVGGKVGSAEVANRAARSLLYRFKGSVRVQDGQARLSTRLLTSSGAVVWSSNDDINLAVERQIELEAHLAASVVSRLDDEFLRRSGHQHTAVK